MELLGFWSYVHADDEVDVGRVVQLAKDIVGYYEAQTAEEIELFLDRDDIKWGDEWRGRIDDSLANVAFFIPVITPRYFKRVECRRELQFFVDRASRLGIRALILPILYIDVPELHDEEPSDPLMVMIKDIQWESWTEYRFEYRFEDREAGVYRGAVNHLARELVDRVATVERVDVVAAANSLANADIGPDDTEDLGVVDRIAKLEEAMPRWTDTLNRIGGEIEAIGDAMARGAADSQKGDAQGKGFAARLTVIRRVANELAEPVANIERFGQRYAADLATVDQGIEALFRLGAEQILSGVEPEAITLYCSFAKIVQDLATSSREGLESVEGMIEASEPLEKMSKDMRPVLRRMRISLTALLEAKERTQAWVDLSSSLGIDCSGVEIVDFSKAAASNCAGTQVAERSLTTRSCSR